jgi:hypothetical protein
MYGTGSGRYFPCYLVGPFRGIEAVMSKAKTWGFSSFGVGVVLAILFGVLSGNSSGSTSSTYLAAAIVCAIAGVVGLLYALFAK